MTSALSMAQWLVVPLVLHILLTFVVGALSLQARIAAVRSNRALLKATALDNSAWPDEARKFSNNFDNQFQVPMLAYTAVAVFLATGTGRCRCGASHVGVHCGAADAHAGTYPAQQCCAAPVPLLRVLCCRHCPVAVVCAALPCDRLNPHASSRPRQRGN